MSELLTVDDVARRCKVHPETVKRAIRDGRLRASTLGARGAYRLRPEWVEEWIEGSSAPGRRSAAASEVPRTRRKGRGRLALTSGMGKAT